VSQEHCRAPDEVKAQEDLDLEHVKMSSRQECFLHFSSTRTMSTCHKLIYSTSGLVRQLGRRASSRQCLKASVSTRDLILPPYRWYPSHSHQDGEDTSVDELLRRVEPNGEED
jgi:phosphoketolase